MRSKNLKYLFNRLTIALTATGAGIWALGLLLPVSERVSQALEHVGLGIGVTTLIATALNYSFEAATRHAFSIVKGAEGAAIHRIFADRCEDALQRMFEVSGGVGREVDLLCVAGTSFLHTESAFLKMLESRRQLNSNIQVRVLLLDPRSRYAILRCLREEYIIDLHAIPPQFHYSSRKLCSDILSAIRTVEDIQECVQKTTNSGCHNFSLKVRLYDAPPKLLNLRVDERSFVEQYHDGIPSDQLESALTKCLGKAVPVMEVNAQSKQGRAYQSHFEKLWADSDTREVRPGTYDQLNASINSKDWVQYHLVRVHEETTLLHFRNDVEKSEPINGNCIMAAK